MPDPARPSHQSQRSSAPPAHRSTVREPDNRAADGGRALAWAGIIVTVILTITAAGSAPWWWKYVHHSRPASAAPPSSQIAGMSGGCRTFQVFAQNRWAPFGTAIRAQPNVLSNQIGSFPGNMSIAVNGWVYGRAAYPTNTPPWNSNVWYHLADGAGWVPFPGVRATPTSHDPTGLANGGDPAPSQPHARAQLIDSHLERELERDELPGLDRLRGAAAD